MMDSNEVRKKFLRFFEDKKHNIISSASLIPENDSSLLFTNSGMFPLVPYFLGEKHPAGQRIVNFQKCFRTEDIDSIGDNRHNTFFEMLGNWSFGDYFKKEQLNWWYEFLIEELKINPSQLYQTVYAGDGQVGKDEESVGVLKEIFKKYGIKAEEGPETLIKGEIGPGREIDFNNEKIFAYRDKNWWQRGEAVGELGGPDSETFYDTGKKHNLKFGKYCHINCDCGRFIEIGNSVFIQYQKTEDGWRELESKNVDFGGGLERITMMVQNKNNVFETDLFYRIIQKIEELSGKKYFNNQKAFEIIADHFKAVVFIMADDKGLFPSNVGQGYVIRRLIRRAIRYAQEIGINQDDWFKDIVWLIKEMYQNIYPELEKNFDFIIREILREEQRFIKTLAKGLKEFEKISDRKEISGFEAFDLYQTYGFPFELIKELSKEREIKIDEKGFNLEFKKHQELSRTASAGLFKGGLVDLSGKTVKLHTATHLLLAALREVLGNHVFQKGSNITTERLRFDFSHNEKLSENELKKIESLINEKIKEDLIVTAEEMDLEEAKQKGILGVFENKYKTKVKVYTTGKDGYIFSREICGGPHAARTSELKEFKILKEEAVAKGIRRIKADIYI